jgi:hypothetical protein
MRAVSIVPAVIGGVVLAAAAAGSVLVEPGPFHAVGLVLTFRGPG